MDDIAIRTVIPKTSQTFTFEDIFDSSEDYIKEEMAASSDPGNYLNKQVWDYMRENWDIDDLINIMDEYIRFIPISKDLNIPDMPERFY